MRVLIVDEGRERSAVAAARGLVSSGWTVGAGSWRPNLTWMSRAATSWHRVVHTREGDTAFVESLNEVVVREGFEAAFVTWERAVRAVSAHRDNLDFPVAYGPHDGVLLAMDKELLPAVAGRAGLGVARTARATPESIAAFTGPVVIKNAWPADVHFPTRTFDDRSAAVAHAAVIDARGGHAIAQEYVDGMLAAVTLVAGPDGIVSYAQQEAELIWPLRAGGAARAHTVPVDPVLRASVEQLIAELQWQGIAHLEFLVGPDGERKLIDFNPRYYGSLALALASGANHVDTWARIATGRPVTPSVGKPDARFQWFSRDLRASLAAPDPLRETARCVAAAPGAVHSVFSWDEPTLAVKHLGQQLGRRLRQELRTRTHAGARPS